MKKWLVFFGFALLFSLSAQGQISVKVADIKTNEAFSINEVYDKYKLNRNLPTIIITWSGKWCEPCIQLIDRYQLCDKAMLNVITINIDEDEHYKESLNKGYHLKWKNSVNLQANLNEEAGGFGRVFNVKKAPLILIMNGTLITDAFVNYNALPYTVVSSGLVEDPKLIWNSHQDLNNLAWDSYLKKKSPEDFNKAIKWVLRSIDLEKNYSNTDTYAALLYKTGDYTKALKTAKEAIELAKKSGEKYETTSDLINKIIEKL